MSRHRFKQIHLEITTLCNLSCSFCPKTGRSPFRITREEFRSRLAQIVPLTDLVYLHLMGEPLSHPLLGEFLQDAEQLGAPIGITTNGTLIESKLDFLRSPSLKQLNVSFHSFSDESAILKTSQLCRDLAEKRPDLYINLRLWNTGHDDSLANNPFSRVLLESFGVEEKASALHEPGRRASLNICGRIYPHLDRPFEWPGSAKPDCFGTCHGLSSHFGVLTDGSVVPCCLDNEGSIVLGNIDAAPIETILDSSRARKIRGGFSRGEMVEELCQKCGYAQDRFGNKKQVVSRRAEELKS